MNRTKKEQPNKTAVQLKVESLLKEMKIDYEAEYKFHPIRKWKMDYALLKYKIGIEIDGGQWLLKSGHSYGTGFSRDREKDREAIMLGWTIIRFTVNDVKKGVFEDYIRKIINKINYEIVLGEYFNNKEWKGVLGMNFDNDTL